MQCEPVIFVEWHPAQEQNGVYRRLLLRRRPGLKCGQQLPAIVCRAERITASGQKLSAYRQLCGFSDAESNSVPLLFPHAMLGSAHLLMLSHEAFPLGSMGMLHLRNHVVRYRDFDTSEPWQMECRIARQRSVAKGLEFDFDSTVCIDKVVVWRSISTYLKRGKPWGEAESPLANLIEPISTQSDQRAAFEVPTDIGRQYARISGDYNPIHISSLAAIFGFKRAIAHGIWSVARSVKELPNIDGPVRLDVAFKGPMYAGSQAIIRSDEQNYRFDLFCGNNPRPVVNAVYRPTNRDDRLL